MFILMEAVLSNSPLVLGTLIAHLEKAGHVMADMGQDRQDWQDSFNSGGQDEEPGDGNHLGREG